MGGLFSSPKMPPVVAAPPAPTPGNSQDAIDKAQTADAIRRRAAGRSSTVLTGSSGLGNLGTVSNTSSLLGGS